VTAEEAEHRDVGDERQEFLEHRQTGLGATDSPKILGLSRWGTALTVYERLVEGPGDDTPSLPAWLGLKLQSTVAELYTAATGNKVRAANQHYRHLSQPWMVCHLDYRVWSNPLLLVECKTRAYMKGWGEDGSTEIPADVWVQVQHEMAVTRATETHVAVLFGHHTFRVYPIPRDEEFITKMTEKLSDFWHNHFLARVPPAVTGHPEDDRYLRRHHPDDDGTLIAATAEQEALVNRLVLAIHNYKQVEQSRLEAENAVKEVIGDAAGLTGSFGSITWKKSKDRESIEWEQVAIVYAGIIEQLMEVAADNNGGDLTDKALAEARAVYETAVDLYTVTKPGSRRFLVNLKES
jgi:putative phage-type endonuclease